MTLIKFETKEDVQNERKKGSKCGEGRKRRGGELQKRLFLLRGAGAFSKAFLSQYRFLYIPVYHQRYCFQTGNGVSDKDGKTDTGAQLCCTH